MPLLQTLKKNKCKCPQKMVQGWAPPPVPRAPDRRGPTSACGCLVNPMVTCAGNTVPTHTQQTTRTRHVAASVEGGAQLRGRL